MDIEVERRQGLAPAPAVGVREEQIGAEPDQSAHRVGLLLQDPLVDFVRGDMLPAGRAQRPLRQAKGARTLLGRQLVPGLSLGILLGALVIVTAWILIWIYVRWANGHYDDTVRALKGGPR